MSPFRGSSSGQVEWKHFDFSVSGGVGTITFMRPDVLNALTFEVYADLRDLLGDLPQHDEVKVLVVTGTGRGFCSGGDVHEIIGELQRMDAHDLLEFTRMTGAVVQRMRDAPVPIIASINGIAAGAGSVIALASDLRLMARSSSFAFLFTKVGLGGADMGSAYLLPRLVGLGRATELLMLGDKVPPSDALAMGLVSKVVEDDELAAATEELARRLADGPSFAYAATKMLLAREQDMSLQGALELEGMTQALLMKSADHSEFYKAFTEGRLPEWKGR